jgi:hypothetical protein
MKVVKFLEIYEKQRQPSQDNNNGDNAPFSGLGGVMPHLLRALDFLGVCLDRGVLGHE